MRTKFTLRKALKFLKNCKSVLSSRKAIFQKNIFPILFCLALNISFAQSGCKATLIVENNGNVRSTPLDGTYYSMVLTNNGSSVDTYFLSSKNINSSCSNTDDSAVTSNVILTADFIDSEKNAISEITLSAGQTLNFYVHITVPVGTAVEKWSCNQIIASSKNCTTYSVETVLHTYIINPVND